MPHYHPTKPEAITFVDFQRIEFAGGKPQLILDLFSYTTSLNLQDFNPFVFGFAGPEDRPPSEDLISESYLSREAELQLQSDPRIDYYTELVLCTQIAAMNLFSSEVCAGLLAKFKLLRCTELISAAITEQSMAEKFVTFTQHTVFGAKCVYVAKRVYNMLSGPKCEEVTKPLFLRTLHKLLTGNETVTSKFAFQIYATRMGTALYQDDVDSMLEDLPPGSPIYEECMKLVDKFVNSAVDKNQETLEFISYKLFCEVIPESLFVGEVIGAFTNPADNVRTNKAFTPIPSKEPPVSHRNSALTSRRASVLRSKSPPEQPPAAV